jgi:septal ring factor EnvC (AmiA/AmiB activator)
MAGRSKTPSVDEVLAKSEGVATATHDEAETLLAEIKSVRTKTAESLAKLTELKSTAKANEAKLDTLETQCYERILAIRTQAK